MQASLGALLCLTYVLWRPVSNGQILYPSLVVLAALSLVNLGKHRGGVAMPFATCGFLLLTGGLLAALVGSLNTTPGLGQQATMWIGGLLVWGSWAYGFRVGTIRRTLTVITVATAILSGLIVIYVAGQQGLVPKVIPNALLDAQAAGFDDTTAGSAIRLYGLSTLAAAGPLVTAALFVGPDPLLPPRRLLAVASMLSILAALVAGRRSILLVVVLSPVLARLILRALTEEKNRDLSLDPRIVVASPALALLAFWVAGTGAARRAFGVVQDTAALYLGVGQVGTTGKSVDDISRQLQTKELINSWGDSPLFGHGLGAVLPSGFQRSAARPWMFELQYHQLLFATGIVGVALVFGAVVVVWLGIREAARLHRRHTPVLVAATVAALALLAANASDPYLQAVGHGWGVALVIGVANALLREKSLPDDLLAVDAVLPKPQVVA